jgi:hypothetical protein
VTRGRVTRGGAISGRVPETWRSTLSRYAGPKDRLNAARDPSTPAVPLARISAVLSASGVATRLREVLARDVTRGDVVALLLTDRSEVLRRRASQDPLASAAPPEAALAPTPVLPSTA